MRRLIAGLLLLAAALGHAPAQADTPWAVVATYPHDRRAFTEGLLFHDGLLYESTGYVGRSDIRAVRLEDGRVLRRARIARPYFGEGIALWQGRLISLTWRGGQGFVWALKDFRQLGGFRYPGEGWGMTSDGARLIMSDGTDTLRFLDPHTLTETGRVTVTDGGAPVPMLNELEYVDGEVLANVWMTDRIARIDPVSGRVIDWIDLSALTNSVKRRGTDDVLNGIAWDAKGQRLFVTGKNWPRLFQIRLDKTAR